MTTSLLITRFSFLLSMIVAYLVSRTNNEDLMLLYNLPAFAKNDATAFLSGVARAHQLVKKVRPSYPFRSYTY